MVAAARLLASVLVLGLCGGCESPATPIPPLPPVPTLTSVAPATLTASASQQTITVTGTDFDGAYGAISMSLSGPSLSGFTPSALTPTSFKLTAVFVPGTYAITVSIRGQVSNAISFVVTAPTS